MRRRDDASGDASAGQNAGNGREVKFGRMLESLIEHGGYSRNRKRISPAGYQRRRSHTVHPPAELAQLSGLLAIADFFDVSLDSLVYGQARAAAASPTTARSTATSITRWRMSRPGRRHNAVVTRIGRMLADRINDVAAELAATPAAARKASCRTMSCCGWRDTATDAISYA